jgi:hypothetical protein
MDSVGIWLLLGGGFGFILGLLIGYVVGAVLWPFASWD